MAHEPGTMHVLWPVRPPRKKLPETVPEISANSGGMSYAGGRPIDFV